MAAVICLSLRGVAPIVHRPGAGMMREDGGRKSAIDSPAAVRSTCDYCRPPSRAGLRRRRVAGGRTLVTDDMLRTCAALTIWAIMAVFLGIPVLLIGFINPSRWVITRSSVLWGKAMLAAAGVRLTVVGREHATDVEPRFYMANHQSALDIPLILAAVGGNVRFFSKSSLLRIPIFGWILARYGIVPIEKSNARATHATLERLLDRLRTDPISLAVFPEGTRTRDGSLSPFRKGTMKIATRAGISVVPVAIEGSLAVNHRDDWCLRPGPVRVTLTEPIPASQVASMTSTALHDRVVSAIQSVLDETNANEGRREKVGIVSGTH